MKKTILFFSLLLVSYFIKAQEEKNEEKKYSVNLYGFVKSDFFWDTRQTVSAREGHFLLFPQPVVEDLNGDDINAKPNFNFLSLQSRFGINAKGPEVIGAKTSAKIEGDFFAQANDNINLFRLRHAFVKLNWTNTELLFGQYWIPNFITGCFPGTVSFNTGTPIQPFGRSPQVRLTQSLGSVKLIGVLSSQRDYANRGPIGASGSYLRNSGIPAADFQIHFGGENKDAGTAFLAGAGFGFKRIVPGNATINGYKSDEGLNSISAIGFAKLKTSAITVKVEGVYSQNADNNLSIGGFTTTEITDAVTGEVKYTPSNTMSLWTDIHSNGKTQYGLFAGYTQNQGFSDDILTGAPVYGLGLGIESLLRVSPRVVFNYDHLRFGIEGEYTVANYGDGTFDEKGIPQNTEAADNFRLLFSVYYFFK